MEICADTFVEGYELDSGFVVNEEVNVHSFDFDVLVKHYLDNGLSEYLRLVFQVRLLYIIRYLNLENVTFSYFG